MAKLVKLILILAVIATNAFIYGLVSFNHGSFNYVSFSSDKLPDNVVEDVVFLAKQEKITYVNIFPDKYLVVYEGEDGIYGEIAEPSTAENLGNANALLEGFLGETLGVDSKLEIKNQTYWIALGSLIGIVVIMVFPVAKKRKY